MCRVYVFETTVLLLQLLHHIATTAFMLPSPIYNQLSAQLEVRLIFGHGNHAFPSGDWKWHGGTYCPVDKCIYGYPNNADRCW
jgi:hypothetical protein